MNSSFSQFNQEMTVLPISTIEDLVSAHYEKVFSLLDTFFEDHRVSLEHTENAFRAMQNADKLNTHDLYQLAVDCIFQNYQEKQTTGGLPTGDAMCFLLKEVGRLRYNEIADITGYTREDVKLHIARARKVLIDRMAH